MTIQLVRMIRKITCFSLYLLTSIFLTNGFAGEYNSHQGFYVAGNIGASLSDKITKSGNTASGVTGFAASLFLARQFNTHFAVEGGFAHYSVSFLGASIFDVVAKGILPLGSRVMLFGKLGGALAETEACFLGCETHNEFAPAVGAGLGVGINQNWATTLEYNAVYLSSSTVSGLIGGLTIGATRYFDA